LIEEQMRVVRLGT